MVVQQQSQPVRSVKYHTETGDYGTGPLVSAITLTVFFSFVDAGGVSSALFLEFYLLLM